ncbi:hypothetical protein L9F63_017847, partial [Diploptera punctata]
PVSKCSLRVKRHLAPPIQIYVSSPSQNLGERGKRNCYHFRVTYFPPPSILETTRQLQGRVISVDDAWESRKSVVDTDAMHPDGGLIYQAPPAIFIREAVSLPMAATLRICSLHIATPAITSSSRIKKSPITKVLHAALLL